MRYVAERKLLYSEKASDTLKNMAIKISEPFVLSDHDVSFAVDGVVSCCHVKIEGLNEPDFKFYGMDSLQAINIASNIDPLLERLSDKYDFFWITGEPYFDE